MSIIRNATIGIAASCALAALAPKAALADEGGVSFWVPGFFGSLAATPQTPGFSFAIMGYHTSVSAGADVAFARQVSRGNITVPFTANVDVNLKARADLALGAVTYVFTDKILGAQASFAVLVPYGRNRVEVDGTLTAAIGPIGFTVGGSREQLGDRIRRCRTDVFAEMERRRSQLPCLRHRQHSRSASYDQNRLANIGIGHKAFDVGGGYTYFNPQTGYEFSSVVGLTYNFENTHTQLSERHRPALGLGRLALHHQGVADRPGGLCLPAAHLRQRVGRPGRLLQVAGHGYRPADRPHLQNQRRLPGLREPQRLRRVRRRASARRLERVADLRDLARRARTGRAADAAEDREVAEPE